MRPANLATKIFLDSGDPAETKQALVLLGFLDGQTTNPSLIAKNPAAQERIAQGKKFTQDEIMAFYRDTIEEIVSLIGSGSVSVEVYADHKTTVDEMLKQGRDMNSWVSTAHVKLPTTSVGLTVAQKFTQEGIRVNMTLCFTDAQAAAVYAATSGAKKGDVFLSPFIGRLDDSGLNGMDLIRNIMSLYSASDHHVEVLAASTRNLNHFLACLACKADNITAPLSLIREWVEAGMPIPDGDFSYPAGDLQPILPTHPNLSQSWQTHGIEHELTTKGVQRFADDWNALLV